ncbi:MAG: transglycosylase SLT domain-containing protein [Arenimonas sp.]|uniref:transglycosylase SLT domain-containing protein n=1 Tax=Arenimonas sp. TaxID=1872635 RepID=UPI0025C364E4|nr:transglycosylase SLT domain-containing protein [Arenimonas sp.]MBW8366339.1 transglycosylase SLT domain-containing protein [Arenimonas sp.]
MTPSPSQRIGLLALTLALAACQPQVKPDIDDPREPATEVRLKPAPPVVKKVEPVRPAVVAPDPIDTGAEVFDRMTARFSAPICVKGQQNRHWRKRYAGYPENFARQIGQILPLMGYVVEEVERKGLPGEFALLPIVESWYRPDAIGPGGPAGMWQMIASTARNHGILIQPGYDGRLSPIESTDAALSYLVALDTMFDGEWRAMAMGYNAGEYRIVRAFRSSGDRRVSGESHLPRGLSRTTYDYVAKLHALACLFEKPERHGLSLPRDARFVPLVRMNLPDGVQSLDQAAVRMGVDAQSLRKLNPGFRQGRVVAGAPRTVLAPATALASLMSGTAAPEITTLPESPEAERTYVVRSGDSLSRIAARQGVPLARLFAINGLNAKSILRPGQVLRLAP